MAYDVLDIARYVINYTNNRNSKISNLQLQKIIYYIQAAFLVIKDEPCFAEDILNWSYGPVVQEVYNEYRDNGNSSIPYQKQYIILDFNKESGDIEFVRKEFDESKICNDDKVIINKIVDNYSEKDAFELVRKTHREDPWKLSDRNSIIKKEDIKKYYKLYPDKLYN